MPLPILRRERTEQPKGPTPIDRDHPALSGVSSSLIAYGGIEGWLQNSGDLILPPTLGGVGAEGTTSLGSGFVFNGTSTYLDYGTNNIPTQEFTFLWGGVFTSVDNFRGLIDCISGANGWTIFQSGTDTLFFSINGYGGATSLSGWTAGQFWNGAVRWKTGGEHAWFRNGQRLSSSTVALTPGTSIASLRIGWQRGGGTVPLKGPLAYGYLLDKWLDDQNIISLQNNPWQIFEQEPEIIYYPAPSAGSNGTVSYTNAGDTVSASGTTTVVGSLAKTNSSDSVSASGKTTVVGALAKTNASDTLAASGSVGQVTGSVARTDASDTSSASGTTKVVGSLAKTVSNDAVSASGATTVKGSSATTNVSDSCAASGSIGNAVSGSVNRTNANDSLVASGKTTVVGTVAKSESRDSVAASGFTLISGSLARANSNDIVVSLGTTTILGLALFSARPSLCDSAMGAKPARLSASAPGRAGTDSTRAPPPRPSWRCRGKSAEPLSRRTSNSSSRGSLG